jgi:hypothetical protein
MFNFAVIMQNPFVMFLCKHLNILANFIIHKTNTFEIYAHFRINHQECYRTWE